MLSHYIMSQSPPALTFFALPICLLLLHLPVDTGFLSSEWTMFKRALAHQSNATPIRSSDRRKLVKDVLSRYDFLPTEANEDEQRELGRLIMPEGIRSANMQTSGGIDGVSYTPPFGCQIRDSQLITVDIIPLAG